MVNYGDGEDHSRWKLFRVCVCVLQLIFCDKSTQIISVVVVV